MLVVRGKTEGKYKRISSEQEKFRTDPFFCAFLPIEKINKKIIQHIDKTL